MMFECCFKFESTKYCLLMYWVFRWLWYLCWYLPPIHVAHVGSPSYAVMSNSQHSATSQVIIANVLQISLMEPAISAVCNVASSGQWITLLMHIHLQNLQAVCSDWQKTMASDCNTYKMILLTVLKTHQRTPLWELVSSLLTLSFTDLWPVPGFTIWWQRHTGVSSLPKATTQWCLCKTRTYELQVRCHTNSATTHPTTQVVI